MRLLLEDSRVDPTARDREAIAYASGNGHTDVVRLLLAGRNQDTELMECAFIAAMSRERSDVMTCFSTSTLGRLHP